MASHNKKVFYIDYSITVHFVLDLEYLRHIFSNCIAIQAQFLKLGFVQYFLPSDINEIG